MAKRILVVDDDPTIVRLVCINLEMEGYEVARASNGREALEQVEAFAPDLVVCDVMMPVMNGLEVVTRLRREPATSALPIVMLSAKAQEIDVRHGKGAGADDYVTKPFDPTDLIETIARVLGAADGKAAAPERKASRPRADAAKQTATQRTRKR